MSETTVRAERPCHCAPVPEHLWTTHYGAVDPATTHEYNPLCPEHGEYSEVELSPAQRKAMLLLENSYESYRFLTALLDRIQNPTKF